jgi:chromosome segregation ATPase
MKKCALWTAAIVAGLVLLCSFTSVGSYALLGWHKVATGVRHAVPPEVEIDRLRMELTKVDQDMQRAFGPIAEQMTKVDNLKKDIADSHVRLDKEKKNILTMKADLESGNRKISYGGKEYPADVIRAKLTRDWETYKIAEQALKEKENLLTAEQQGLDHAKEQVAAMRSTKEQLEVEVAKLEAELKAVRLAETKSQFTVDDSRLSRIKASMKDLHDRIESEKHELTLQQTFADTGTIPVDQKVKQNEVLKEIDDHFTGNAEKVADKE